MPDADGVSALPLRGLPEVRDGDDLAALLLDAGACAPVHGLRDERTRVDAHGYVLGASVLAVADELTAAAELVMGKLDAVPAAVVRGYTYERGEGTARELLRPPATDMFR